MNQPADFNPRHLQLEHLASQLSRQLGLGEAAVLTGIADEAADAREVVVALCHRRRVYISNMR